MKNLSQLFICLLSIPLLGQLNHREIEINDFNGDSYIDTLEMVRESGNGYSKTVVTLVNGKTNEKFILQSNWNLGVITGTILIPPQLTKPSNRPFLEAMKEKLSLKVRAKPDPSLQWILNSRMNFRSIKEHPYFNLWIDKETQWHTGKVELPTFYSVEIKGEVLDSFFYLVELNQPSLSRKIQKGDKAFLTYSGKNHYSYEAKSELMKKRNPCLSDSLCLVDQNEKYSIYKTMHGVLAKRGNEHAWIFVSGFKPIYGPEKLRWTSFEQIVLQDDKVYVLVSHTPTGLYSLYIIDLNSGKLARFNQTVNKHFRLENGFFYFESYDQYDEEGSVVELSKLKEALEKLK